MVYVIVEVEQNQIGDIINRLLGSRHKVTVVENLSTACGCETQPAPKRKNSEIPSTSSCIVSSSKSVTSADINALVSRVYPEPPKNQTNEEDTDYEVAGYSTYNALLDLLGDPRIPSTSGKESVIESKRNNGVPYNSNAIVPQEDLEDERAFTECMDGVDMAIKCMLCERVIALGTRPANHSTRKYAHARCHGFKNRFECSICHAVFRNKRVTFNHFKTIHGQDTTFRIIDNWTEESQRELITMVKKCFPKENKPFTKRLSAHSNKEEDKEEEEKELDKEGDQEADLKIEME